MPQTWSATLKSANITLSNGNLTGTHTANTGEQSDCAAITLFTTGAGNYYWELTLAGTGFPGDGAGVGLASSVVGQPLFGGFLGVDANGLGLFFAAAGDGFYYNNSRVLATPNLTSAALTAASGLVCLAWDNVNALLYARLGTTGNWNGNALADPTTQTGGCAVDSGIFTLGNVGPGFNTRDITVDIVTAAFVYTSWVGTAPTGFTDFDGGGGGPPPPAGWPTNDVIVFAGGPPP